MHCGSGDCFAASYLLSPAHKFWAHFELYSYSTYSLPVALFNMQAPDRDAILPSLNSLLGTSPLLPLELVIVIGSEKVLMYESSALSYFTQLIGSVTIKGFGFDKPNGSKGLCM